jgi:hypothetical protein
MCSVQGSGEESLAYNASADIRVWEQEGPVQDVELTFNFSGGSQEPSPVRGLV